MVRCYAYERERLQLVPDILEYIRAIEISEGSGEKEYVDYVSVAEYHGYYP